jgi:hypothetical protein
LKLISTTSLKTVEFRSAEMEGLRSFRYDLGYDHGYDHDLHLAIELLLKQPFLKHLSLEGDVAEQFILNDHQLPFQLESLSLVNGQIQAHDTHILKLLVNQEVSLKKLSIQTPIPFNVQFFIIQKLRKLREMEISLVVKEDESLFVEPLVPSTELKIFYNLNHSGLSDFGQERLNEFFPNLESIKVRNGFARMVARLFPTLKIIHQHGC